MPQKSFTVPILHWKNSLFFVLKPCLFAWKTLAHTKWTPYNDDLDDSMSNFK